jgi:hypothetical protein
MRTPKGSRRIALAEWVQLATQVAILATAALGLLKHW